MPPIGSRSGLVYSFYASYYLTVRVCLTRRKKDTDDADTEPGARAGMRSAPRQRGDPAEGGAPRGGGGGGRCRACAARRAPPAQRRRGGRRARRRVVAVGAAGRVRRAYREH